MRKYSNTATATTLTTGITSSDTTMTVGNTTGWPTPSGGDTATLVINYDNDAAMELIEYTGKTSTTFTGITRGVDGTTAKAHTAGAKIKHGVSATNLEEIGAMQRQANAKGDMWIASADNTPLIVSVGANDKVWTADSVAAGGASWKDIPTQPSTGNSKYFGQAICPTAVNATAINEARIIPLFNSYTNFVANLLRIRVMASSGNISVALYNSAGTSQLTTSGAIACPAVGWADIDVPNVTLAVGHYYGVVSVDNITATFGATSGWLVPGTGTQASAHPAPTSITIPSNTVAVSAAFGFLVLS